MPENTVQAVEKNKPEDIPPENSGQVKEQVQQETQNEADEIQIQIQTQEEVQEGVEEEEDTEEATKQATVKESGEKDGKGEQQQIAREKMNEVAKKAGELISQGKQYQGGIGDQINEVARQQRNAVGKAEEKLDKVERRKGLSKFILGPDYKAIDELEKIRQQNEGRIQQLNDLKGELTNETDKQQVDDLVQTVEESNNVLGTRLQEELKSFSLLGWLFRLL